MNFRVAFATSSGYPELHPDDRRTFAPLEAVGIAVEIAQWTDPAVDWASFDAVVIRSCWDYFERADLFAQWLRRLRDGGVRLLNPAEIVLDNMDKRYLKKLEGRGATIVPTAWLEQTDVARIPAFLAALPWQELVVKPAVSAGAYRTVRTTKAALLANSAPLLEVLRGSTALVQPYLSEIERGEWSFLFFGEAFSHAVVKVPKSGDFRVQWRHGGTHRKVEPPASLVAQVERIRGLLPPGRLFARIDGVDVQGQFQLIEVEMIEPYLFFEEDPAAPGRFAAALRDIMAEPA